MSRRDDDYESYGCCKAQYCAEPLSINTTESGLCFGHEDYEPCAHCEVAFEPGVMRVVWMPGEPFQSNIGEAREFIAEHWCATCVAAFELATELHHCRECDAWYHDDLDAVHGGVCDTCEEMRDEANSCAEMAVAL